MAAERNIEAIAARPNDCNGHPLLREGPLIELVRGAPHPSDVAKTAKRIVAAVELARGPNLNTVASRLVTIGICRTQQSAIVSLEQLKERLKPKQSPLNNLYLHITFACQLKCSHCYARADAKSRNQGEVSVEALRQLVCEARNAGFRQVVILGGEPLIHAERSRLLPALRGARDWATPMNLVLRTNLAMPLGKNDLLQIAAAVDQVVVSIDGSPQTHDARRGNGSYAAAVANMEAYMKLAVRTHNAAELSLAMVARSADIRGKAGSAVQTLAARLGIPRVRFRPVLPMGRAADWDEPPTSEALGAHADPMDLIQDGFRPVATCGLGQSLHVDPSGESFPCYVLHQPHAKLGNVIEHGLDSVLNSGGFRDLSCHNVDTNPKCRECEVRYLCGGACRVWAGETAQYDLDALPLECEGLNRRANRLLAAAAEFLSTGRSENQSCSTR